MFLISKTRETQKRFSSAKFFQWSSELQVYDPITGTFHRLVKKLPRAGSLEHKFPRGRVDLASFNIYGDTQFAWLLQIYNNWASFYDLKTGDLVDYPALRDIEQLSSTFHRQTNRFI